MIDNKNFKKFIKENNGLLNKLRMKYIYLPNNSKEQCGTDNVGRFSESV